MEQLKQYHKAIQMLIVAKATVTCDCDHMAFGCRQDRPSFGISVHLDDTYVNLLSTFRMCNQGSHLSRHHNI